MYSPALLVSWNTAQSWLRSLTSTPRFCFHIPCNASAIFLLFSFVLYKNVISGNPFPSAYPASANNAFASSTNAFVGSMPNSGEGAPVAGSNGLISVPPFVTCSTNDFLSIARENAFLTLTSLNTSLSTLKFT